MSKTSRGSQCTKCKIRTKIRMDEMCLDCYNETISPFALRKRIKELELLVTEQSIEIERLKYK
jgi:hypothetical protein